MKSKVVHLSVLHQPDDVRVYHKMCRTLAAAGYGVTFVVPGARDSTADGVSIRSWPRRAGRWARLCNHFHLWRLAVRERGHLYHFHDPELIPVGMLLQLCGKRVIYDVHEDLPKQILSKRWIASWLRPMVSRVARRVEAAGARCFDGIVAATPGIAARFPKATTVTVCNFPLADEIAAAPDAAETPGASEKPVAPETPTDRDRYLIYAGGITAQRGIGPLVEAMRQLGRYPGLRLVVAGKFMTAGLEDAVTAAAGWSHVDYLGWQSRAELRRLLRHACAGVVTFLPAPNHTEAWPNKMFEYMAAGLPIIASDFPLWRSIVEQNRCGLLVDPADPAAIAAAARWLVEHPAEARAMGLRGRDAVRRHYQWDRQAEILLACYERLLDENHHRRRSAAAVCQGGHRQPAARAVAGT